MYPINIIYICVGLIIFAELAAGPLGFGRERGNIDGDHPSFVPYYPK